MSLLAVRSTWQLGKNILIFNCWHKCTLQHFLTILLSF
jgi:hypothetical protein